MTTHKVQGQTMQQAIVDFEGCSGTEAPYVMLSHITLLDGLLVLRPFNKKKICCHQSEDMRLEQNHQSVLAQQTLIDHTTDPAEWSRAVSHMQAMLGSAFLKKIRTTASGPQQSAT